MSQTTASSGASNSIIKIRCIKVLYYFCSFSKASQTPHLTISWTKVAKVLPKGERVQCNFFASSILGFFFFLVLALFFLKVKLYEIREREKKNSTFAKTGWDYSERKWWTFFFSGNGEKSNFLLFCRGERVCFLKF